MVCCSSITQIHSGSCMGPNKYVMDAGLLEYLIDMMGWDGIDTHRKRSPHNCLNH